MVTCDAKPGKIHGPPPFKTSHPRLVVAFKFQTKSTTTSPTQLTKERYVGAPLPLYLHIKTPVCCLRSSQLALANQLIAASCTPLVSVYLIQQNLHTYIMAEGAPSVPTFKLVLVGDGGTGKVRSCPLLDVLRSVHFLTKGPLIQQWWRTFGISTSTNILADHLRQASLDW